ncbi:MAG: chorismate mutase-family protein [Caulobacteraceae bacterium]|nr:chorismate mutase-family protein [Caulobacteraceae bacterium]
MASNPVRSLAEVRARIDALDSELLALVDERAALARDVAAAKEARGETGFGLRPAREAALLRGLLARPRKAADDALVIRLWRELMGSSLALQGRFELMVYGGRDVAGMVEQTRRRFGGGPGLTRTDRAETALAAARLIGGVGVLSLYSDTPWWGRMLLEPKLRVFAALPCLAAWGPIQALAVADVEVEPTGADQTFFVSDAEGAVHKVIDDFSRLGAAAELLAEAGGLKLYSLAGYYQADDERLRQAPGRLTGVIGAAPLAFDL